jgi:hypothetical protein
MEPEQNNPSNEPTQPTESTTQPAVSESVESTVTEPTPSTTTTAPSAGNKKLLLGVLAAVGVLLVILIVLLIMLLGKKDDTKTGDKTNTDTNNSQQAGNDNTADSKKKIIKTVPTNDENISLVLYEPRQTGSNTTIEYALKNTCAGCQNKTYTSLGDAVGYSYTSVKNDYLLDEDAGQKYNPIVDEDGKILMTPETNASLEANETSKDMFIAFTKVPSGTTVSLVLNSLRIDGIQIP